jgi:hypothetical protein
LYVSDPDGRYRSATAGARHDDELPEAEATTLARLEGAPQLRPISPLVPVSSLFLEFQFLD